MNHARALLVGGVAAALGALASACATATSTTTSTTTTAPIEPESTSAPSIAAVHRAKCGGCHEAPEPGGRERTYVAAAMDRHEKRVRLSAEEWKQMVDYLAGPSRAQAKAPSESSTR